jgi:hypothetical protein
MPVETIVPLSAADAACSLEELERRIASERQTPSYYCTVDHGDIEQDQG